MYDYLIIGAGLFGSICARELIDRGNKCMVIEKRNHIGGNCYTENIDGINIHKYGPHIFHTSNKEIWEYINRYAIFNHYINRPKVSYNNSLYSFPINLFSMYQVYGVKTPEEARKKINSVKIPNNNPKNLEEWILSQVGPELYEIFIKGYTIKQWGRNPKNLPVSIIKRLPLRFTFDDNYYTDCYQGIPIGGYTQIFEKLLNGIEISLNTDYLSNRNYYDSLAKKIIYTGPIDGFYNYRFGKLNYRSLRFDIEYHSIEDYQGNSIINFSDIDLPYTRIVEHKHFEFKTTQHTIISKEYSIEWNEDCEPYYPIEDVVNTEIYKTYKILSDKDDRYIFGGRLAAYRYYDMHQIIKSALHTCKKL